MDGSNLGAIAMTRWGVIDIGTNSVKLLIAEFRGEQLWPVYEAVKTTRLGAAYGNGLQIPETTRQLTVRTVCEFFRKAQEMDCAEVHCYGTQIFRTARNASQLSDEIYRNCHCQVEVLQPHQEAALTFRGALDTLRETPTKILAMDIGGGSVEIILGTRKKPEFAKSFPLGMVFLKDKFQLGERLTARQQKELREYLTAQFSELPAGESAPFLLGIGGTFTTLAALHQGLKAYDFAAVDGYWLRVREIEQMFDHLNRLSLKERRKLPGMEPGREDVILPAIIIVQTVLNLFSLNKLCVSARGPRFGYLLWKLNKISLENEAIPVD